MELAQRSKGASKDLTVGSVKKNILTFALPILISQIFQQFYNIADSLIVGNFIGKNALAAVSTSGNLIFLLISFFEGAAMGAGVVIAKYFGANELDKVSKAIHTNILFGFICGVILTVFGVALTPYILKLMQTDQEVLPLAIEYFRYYFIGVLAVVMYNIFTGIMRAVGDSKRPLIYLIVSSVLNIGLDILFVKGLGFGVASCAVATTLSQFFSVILCVIQLKKKNTVYYFQFKKLRIDKEMLSEMLRYGLPTGVQNSVIGFANVIVQTNINIFGADAMAGYGAYIKIEGIAFLPINCIAMALSTFIGQNLGAGKYDRAKEGAKFGLIISPITAEIIGILCFILAPFLIGAFNRTQGVLSFGVREMRIESLFYFLLSFSHIVAAILRGAGKAVVPMMIMLAIWCVFRIIYITVIADLLHDINYIYLAYPITWTMSSVVFLIYYRKSDWIHGLGEKPIVPQDE